MKRFFFLLFAFTVAVMSWEGQMASANLVDNGPIPQESIRLRIIANSDSVQDQWLKREVRDAIVAQMNTWVTGIESYEQAEQYVAGKLPELQKLVDKTITDRGFSYPAAVDFGQVPFPTKLYGSYVYPAGNYEALRVSIGDAKGQNWWCVLFPPLCFIDMANGDAVKKEELPAESPEQTSVVQASAGSDSEEKTVSRITEREEYHALRQDIWRASVAKDAWYLNQNDQEDDQSAAHGDTDNSNSSESIVMQTEQAVTATAQSPQVEVRFYLWDKLVSIF